MIASLHLNCPRDRAVRKGNTSIPELRQNTDSLFKFRWGEIKKYYLNIRLIFYVHTLNEFYRDKNIRIKR